MKTTNFTEKEKNIYHQLLSIKEEVEVMLFTIEVMREKPGNIPLEDLKTEVKKLEELFKKPPCPQRGNDSQPVIRKLKRFG